ncbi:MAG: hypothetical protein ACP5FK_12755 [bacterium]
MQIPYFIIGAMVKDILFEHYHDIKSTRITRDIDLGIRVQSWDEYNKLDGFLINSDKFEKSSQMHRYKFHDIYIDIIPFGGIAENEEKIIWPDDERIMNTLGFKEVFKNSISVRINEEPVLDIKCPTIPGLTLLKLISWKDNYPYRKKDAEDLLFIIENYWHTDITDTLYDKHLGLMKKEDFDLKLSSIIFLGKNITEITGQESLSFIKDLLDQETADDSEYRLIMDMLKPDLDFDYILKLVKKLKEGIFIDL